MAATYTTPSSPQPQPIAAVAALWALWMADVNRAQANDSLLHLSVHWSLARRERNKIRCDFVKSWQNNWTRCLYQVYLLPRANELVEIVVWWEILLFPDQLPTFFSFGRAICSKKEQIIGLLMTRFYGFWLVATIIVRFDVFTQPNNPPKCINKHGLDQRHYHTTSHTAVFGWLFHW
jgi:hypothetical protein